MLQPDPGYKSARFLGWLKKRGAVRRLSECIGKWADEGLDVERPVKRLLPENIGIYRSRGCEKVVWLRNLVWADRWMARYDLEVPHHGKPLRTEKKGSETEK
jgi:hypothetical protein